MQSRFTAVVAIMLTITSLALPPRASAQEPTFRNPILRGGYPDPSICHYNGFWYLVNSSFEYFPGLPIHRSNDLVNWELIGYGLHRGSQVTGAVNLVDVQSNGGIHAPTIRCQDGRFLIITTNVYLPPGENQQAQMVNFVITADDPAGPWSDPHVLEGAPGIDPDIFFDDDGRAWYAGTHAPENPSFPGEGEIWLQEIDTQKWALKGERHFLWRGACGGTWAEGPHIYKRDGRYYLLVAEGGTSFDHAVMVAVADEITGPYHSNPRNPILTSRHLSYDHWVNSTGHADLFELPDGRWYLVTLGIRGDIERRSNMGRETHLAPVQWEREPYEWKDVKYEWPVASPDSGRVEQLFPLPFEGTQQTLATELIDDFDTTGLSPQWIFRRYPRPGSWSLQDNAGFLRLSASPHVISERGRASLAGIRQTETAFAWQTRMLFAPSETGSEAGIVLLQKDDNYIGLTIVRKGDGYWLQLTVTEPGEAVRIENQARVEGYKGEIYLKATGNREGYRFEYSLHENHDWSAFGQLEPGLILSQGYTGALLGLYATGNGRNSPDVADFDWVHYQAEMDRN